MAGGIPEIIGSIFIAVGAFFFVVGAVGLYRMPDVFTRMHAAGISDTVGAGLLLVGMMFFSGFTLITIKLAIILGVILFTSPIATHALAQAALHAGVEPVLDSTKVLVGPGAHAEPERARTTVKKARSSAAKRKPPVKKAASRARRKSPGNPSGKGRTRS